MVRFTISNKKSHDFASFVNSVMILEKTKSTKSGFVNSSEKAFFLIPWSRWRDSSNPFFMWAKYRFITSRPLSLSRFATLIECTLKKDGYFSQPFCTLLNKDRTLSAKSYRETQPFESCIISVQTDSIVAIIKSLLDTGEAADYVIQP